MALKTILDGLENVPEDGRIHEVDGKFVLDIDGIDAHPAVVNLTTAHERTKADKKRLGDENTPLKARVEGLPDDFDADAYEELKSQAEGKAPKKTDEQVAQVRQQLEKMHNIELAKKDECIATLEGAVTKATIDDGLSKALDEAGVDPAFKPGANGAAQE